MKTIHDFLAAKRSSTNALVVLSVCLSISKLNFSLFGQVMTTYAQLEEMGKVDYWATGLLVMTFIDPYCNTGSFINEVLRYSKIGYFGPL